MLFLVLKNQNSGGMFSLKFLKTSEIKNNVISFCKVQPQTGNKMIKQNYAASHPTFKVSTKRFNKSPFIERFDNSNTIFGIYADRLYPLSTGGSIEKDYWNLRKNVMLYDVPEKPLEISGPDSVSFLENIFTRKVHDIKPMRARYALACSNDGSIMMDGVLIRLSNEKFWYVHANGDFETWLIAHKKDLNLTIKDPQSWALQIQGPNALKVLASASPSLDLQKFKYFHAVFADFNGKTFLVSRTGWTGELGFEIYTNGQNEDHLFLWDYVIKNGQAYGISVGGLDSMGIRRIEAGILDYGTDMNRAHNPFEIGLRRYVDLSKDEFIGRSSLLKMNRESKFYGIKCPDTIPFQDLEILHNNEIVGKTTVGAFSPYLRSGIGYALFYKYENWESEKLVLRGNDKILYECTATTLPFYDGDKAIPRGLKSFF